MGLSLKIKLTALITLLVLLMVLATSTLYLSHLTRQALSEVESRGEYVANEIYHQASTLLSQAECQRVQTPPISRRSVASCKPDLRPMRG